jgi:hypothetical protein
MSHLGAGMLNSQSISQSIACVPSKRGQQYTYQSRCAQQVGGSRFTPLRACLVNSIGPAEGAMGMWVGNLCDGGDASEGDCSETAEN